MNDAADTPGPGVPRPGVPVTLAVCVVLSLGASLLFALTSGEFITHFHKACLHRYTDVDGFLYHITGGTAETTHPAYTPYVRYNRAALITLARALISAGLSFPLAVNLEVLLVRTAFGVGLSWLILAATGKRPLAVFGVLLAYCIPSNAHIYGHLFHPALTGYFATSLFLTACSLCLLGYRRASIACWLLHLWAHPTTFVCWSPVFIGLYLVPLLSRWPSFGRYVRPYLILLVVGPLLAGLAVGLAERAGLLPFRGDETYWALVRVKACHSVFLFQSGYALPLQYASQVAALLILALAGRDRASPLRMLNVLAGFGGLGIGLMWAATVETEFSVVANMCMPLRFESVMYPLLLVNVVRLLFALEKDRAKESTFAAGYGLLLLFPVLQPLTWAWAWALGHAWQQGDGRRRRACLVAAVAGACAVSVYLISGPSGQPMEWNVRRSLPPIIAGVGMLALFSISLWLRLTWQRAAYAAACVACALIAPRFWVTNPDILRSEVKAILGRQPENSPEKQACDWINANTAPGTPVLVSQQLFLHRLTHVRTSLNKDLIEYFLYAPHLARPLADEMMHIYGIDVCDLARRHQRLNLTADDWLRARACALRPAAIGEHTWRYVVEPARVAPADGAAVVFSNSFVRIYRVDASARPAVVLAPGS